MAPPGITGSQMMNEKHVTVGCLVAYGLWIGTLALLIVGTVLTLIPADEMWGVAVLAWALCGSAAAATATIRRFFAYQNRMMRNAYELGRDSVEAKVARLR
jgi:hypothetical protein